MRIKRKILGEYIHFQDAGLHSTVGVCVEGGTGGGHKVVSLVPVRHHVLWLLVWVYTVYSGLSV